MPMMRPLVRCASLKAHLQENVFGPGRLSTDAPVLVFAARPATVGATQQLSPLKPLTQSASNLNALFHRKSKSSGDVDLRVATLASPFPTRQDVRMAQQLIHETGTRTVLGVGSGAVMDLVKSLDLGGRVEDQQKVLIPGTSAAIMAAHTSRALILDEETQLLWTQPCPTTAANVSAVGEPGTIAASRHTAPACHTLLIDACSRAPVRVPEIGFTNKALALDPIVEGPLHTSLYLEQSCQQTTTNEEKTSATAAVAPGKLVIQSAPLALAAALLPAFFPQASIFSFWAALLPGMASLHGKTIHRDQFPHLSDLASTDRGEAPPSVETLMGNVHLHQQLTVGSGPQQDAEMGRLEQILRSSLSRD